MAVRFPCSMYLQHGNSVITSAVRPNDKAEFIFGSPVKLSLPHGHDLVLSVFLLTLAQDTYSSGLIQLPSWQLSALQPAKLQLPILKCVDQQAVCHLEIVSLAGEQLELMSAPTIKRYDSWVTGRTKKKISTLTQNQHEPDTPYLHQLSQKQSSDIPSLCSIKYQNMESTVPVAKQLPNAAQSSSQVKTDFKTFNKLDYSNVAPLTRSGTQEKLDFPQTTRNQAANSATVILFCKQEFLLNAEIRKKDTKISLLSQQLRQLQQHNSQLLEEVEQSRKARISQLHNFDPADYISMKTHTEAIADLQQELRHKDALYESVCRELEHNSEQFALIEKQFEALQQETLEFKQKVKSSKLTAMQSQDAHSSLIKMNLDLLEEIQVLKAEHLEIQATLKKKLKRFSFEFDSQQSKSGSIISSSQTEKDQLTSETCKYDDLLAVQAKLNRDYAQLQVKNELQQTQIISEMTLRQSLKKIDEIFADWQQVRAKRQEQKENQKLLNSQLSVQTKMYQHASQHLEMLKAQNSRISRELALKQSQLGQANEKIDFCEQIIEEVSRELQEELLKNEIYKQKIAQYKSSDESLDEEILQIALEELKIKLASVEELFFGVETANLRLHSQVSELESQVEVLKASLSAEHISRSQYLQTSEEYESALQRAKLENDKLQVQVSILEQAFKREKDNYESTRKHLREKQTELNDLKDKTMHIIKQNKTAQQTAAMNIKELESQLKAAEQALQTKSNAISELETNTSNQIKELSKELTRTNAAGEEYEELLGQYRAAQSVYIEKMERMNGQLEEYAQKIESFESREELVINELVEKQKEYHIAMSELTYHYESAQKATLAERDTAEHNLQIKIEEFNSYVEVFYKQKDYFEERITSLEEANQQLEESLDREKQDLCCFKQATGQKVLQLDSKYIAMSTEKSKQIAGVIKDNHSLFQKLCAKESDITQLNQLLLLQKKNIATLEYKLQEADSEAASTYLTCQQLVDRRETGRNE